MSMAKKPVSRKDGIVVQDIDREVLIYDLRANKAFCLNETSALVWRACDGARDIPSICQHVSERFNSPATEDLVWLALDQLKKEKLLQEGPDINERFAGMSRREVIRKIGLGTAVAIPVVAGLIAPHAVHANSACVAGGSCTCTANSGGMVGQVCTASVACADVNCNCSWENNGNMNGVCIA